MSIIKKTSMTLLCSFSITQASAPAPERVKQAAALSVWGTMYPVGNMKYLGEDPQDLLFNWKLKHILDENDQPIALKSSDVIIDVRAASDEAKNWFDPGHPALGRAFPEALPISMLEEKKEDDFLICKLKCPDSKKIFHLLLICKGRNGERFELQLTRLKEWFSKELHFNPSAEKRLLEQQIIVKNPMSTQILELEKQLRNTPSLLWLHDSEVAQICAQKGRLQRAIAQKKTEWKAHGELTSFGTIPQYLHGPNGFKLASVPTIQSDDAQPQAHQEQHAAQSTSSIAAQALILMSAKPQTKLNEMD
ncbi:MAG: hypothetical protein P4L31_00165 [Candidatus Babeliales bacterium]|nr:hypothetical protein [Candidatus Babeliales bacterium]